MYIRSHFGSSHLGSSYGLRCIAHIAVTRHPPPTIPLPRDDMASLILSLHGDALRAISKVLQRHCEGLQQASRLARQQGLITNKLAKSLCQLDIVFNLVRHVAEPSAKSMMQEIERQLSMEKAGKQEAEQEKAEKEKVEKEQAEKEKAEKDQAEKEKTEKEKAEKEKTEKVEKEKTEKAEKEKAEKEKAEKEKAESMDADEPRPGDAPATRARALQRRASVHELMLRSIEQETAPGPKK